MGWIFFHFRQSFRIDDSVFAKTTKLPKQTRFVENRLPAEAPVGRSDIGKRYYEIITTTITVRALKRVTADSPKDILPSRVLLQKFADYTRCCDNNRFITTTECGQNIFCNRTA
jgi:hypothetical protein